MKKNKQKGFSLAEILIALSILVIGIMAVVQLFPIGLKSGREAKNRSQAINLAQAKMEEYLAENYDSIDVTADEPKERVSSSPSSPFYNYYRSVDLQYTNSSLVPQESDIGLVRIVTTVYWQTSSGEKNISLTVIKSK